MPETSIYAVFHPQHDTSNTARDFLSQISEIQISNEVTDLEKLTIFLEAARKLNTTGVLDEILLTLLDVTLKLACAERGYVFLKDRDGKLKLAAGRNSKGELLLDDTTISHSILDDALRSNSEVLLTDTSRSLDLAGRQSIVAYDLRTVIFAFPLRKLQVQTRSRGANEAVARWRSHGRALRGFALRLARYLESERRHPARYRYRSGVADRKRAPGASGRRIPALSAGIGNRSFNPAEPDGGDYSRCPFRATTP